MSLNLVFVHPLKPVLSFPSVVFYFNLEMG